MTLAFELRMPRAAFDLDVHVETHARTLGLFGPSGCGKTSILEALAGWSTEHRGRVRFGDRWWLDSERSIHLPARRRGVGYVPQDLLLFPHWSVERNVLAGAGRCAADAAPGLRRVFEVLELEALRQRSVATLSGGEKQRVALARALCSSPALLLLDEPLGALDRPLRRRILPYLVRVRDEFDVPMVVVSHDSTEIAVLAEEVVLLEAGRVVAQGAVEQVFAGEQGWRAAGGEFENVLRGSLTEIRGASAMLDVGGALLEVPATGVPAGRSVLVAVRADEILVALERPHGISARNAVVARIEALRDDGGAVRMLAALGGAGQRVWVALTTGAVSELDLHVGRLVFLVVKTRSFRVLSEARSR